MFFGHSLKKVLVAVLIVGEAIHARAGKDNESSVVPLGRVKEDNSVVGRKHIDDDNPFHRNLIEEEQENRGVSDRIPVPLKDARIGRITKAGKKTKPEKTTKINKSADPSTFPSAAPSAWPSTTPSYTPSAFIDTLQCDDQRPPIPANISFEKLVSDYLDGETNVYGNPMGCWKTSAVTNMDRAFVYRREFTGEDEFIEFWDVGSVTSMDDMFYYNSAFNQPIGNWNVSSVTSMNRMFRSSAFNQPIGNWNVTSVESMDRMFFNKAFNQSIGNWNVSSVTSMHYMFYDNTAFNQPIGNWNVASVTLMDYMFGSSAFNQPIGNWNVTSVESMWSMFGSSAFNQPIGNWNVTSVESMGYMFAYSAFNQCLSSWAGNLTGNVDMSNIFSNSACTYKTAPTDPFDGADNWCGC